MKVDEVDEGGVSYPEWDGQEAWKSRATLGTVHNQEASVYVVSVQDKQLETEEQQATMMLLINSKTQTLPLTSYRLPPATYHLPPTTYQHLPPSPQSPSFARKMGWMERVEGGVAPQR